MISRIGTLALGCLVMAVPDISAAEALQPFPSFESRRVKAPAHGTPPKITVQIDPAEQAAILARPKPGPRITPESDDEAAPAVALAPGGSPGRYAWFWDKISPDLAQAGPGRFFEAMRAIGGADKVSAPRLQTLQAIAREQAVPILRSTVGTQVSPALVLAVISVESAGKPDAVSGAGAQGLMQLMPATAERFGVTDSLKPDENIAGGVKYLDWLMKEFGNDPILVLAGYNAGEGSVRNHQGVPPFAETRDYVPKVLAAFQVASGLCTTPPELISDGCVFVTMN